MSGHLASEILSAYLDEELVPRESDHAEDHLSDCPECRQRLAGLRSVVARLHGVQTGALPPYLSGQATALISLEATPKSLIDRFEARMRRLYFPQSTIPLAFGLVMALVMTVYVFTWAVHETKSARSAVPDESTSVDSVPVQEVLLGSARFVRQGSIWQEVSVGEASPGRRIAVSTEEGAQVLETMPGLAGLLVSSSGAVVTWRGEVVLLFLEKPLEQSPLEKGPSPSDSGSESGDVGDR